MSAIFTCLPVSWKLHAIGAFKNGTPLTFRGPIVNVLTARTAITPGIWAMLATWFRGTTTCTPL